MTDQVEDQWKSSELLYEYICTKPGIDVRLKKSIDRIRSVCNEIAEEARRHKKLGGTFKRSPIFIAEVGRRCTETFGGPSAASIVRNRSKEPLKAIYIELRSEELRLDLRMPATADPSRSDDTAVAAYVRSLEQRLSVSEQMVIGLSQTLRGLRPVSLQQALISGTREGDSLDLVAGAQERPSDTEVSELIQKLLDERHLSRFGLRLDRSVFNSATGEELLSPEDVSTLQRLR
ncbi:TPA: hypothetical protein ACOEOC_000550 [Stenotrophomonas maltophilia]|uniref:Uncharacterized protein n=1 Tax=Stenotrophomonas maltophilia TaxID=40324 RepID=A0AAI9G405_STEMA|nr:hypothetical protein [Stenotrophomonas maltophilia]EKT2105185.1 hypothetical protein [Stenotrophomonas maltophilia]EKZ1926309.1 hypothetical protein [Stenotrophomonas maltophilia]ELE7121591.1 hypothetical protein [Stenotrophomonas maltophilia]EMB2744246.1 hypothetical protein [Stenotrophomonas maltophilia]MBH1413124.1 hypothetical protein [Stenotrophomonas maltophilia]